MAKLTKEEKRRRRRRKRMAATAIELAALAVVLVICIALFRSLDSASRPSGPSLSATAAPTVEPTPEPTATPTAAPTAEPTPVPTPTPEPTPVSITITAVGDCTLGGDMNGSSEERFAQMVRSADGGVDYDYCFRNVRSIFEADDLTLVNLEVVLTDSSDYLKREDKIYIMRGSPEYVNMLTGSSVEVCNIANNHMTDFGDAGIAATAELLDENGLAYCGYGYTSVLDVKGVRVGFVGINYWTTDSDEFESTIRSVREQCDVLIVSIHWGSELEYYATDKQRTCGKKAVDLGADLVIGHHPHVLEGIENYKGVNIVYSLGNFCFGGKKNPADKDTFIYQATFTQNPDGTFDSDFNIIPCKITSVADESSNNYQPTPVTDPDEQARILEKIEYYSRKLDNPVSLTD